MNKMMFWKSDWFVGLVVVLVFLAGANSSPVQSLENWAYDLGVRHSSRTPSDRIAVIAIDDQSIANIGRWPWPREVHAQLLDKLAAVHPKVIGDTIFFFEPEIDPGLNYIRQIGEFVDHSSLKNSSQSDVVELRTMLQEASLRLEHDQILGTSLEKTGNVSLPMFFQLGEPQGKPDQPLPDYIQKNALTRISPAGGREPLLASGVGIPIPELGGRAAVIGHLSIDKDDGVRADPLVVNYYGQYYPSLSLMLAARSLNLGPKDIQVNLGEGVKLGNLSIATDPLLRMRTFFYADRELAGRDPKPAFQVDSFDDVLNNKVALEKYRDKIVLIGATATGVDPLQETPIAPMPSVLTLAHTVSSILQQDFFVVPPWAPFAEWGAFLVIALYLMLLLPRLGAKMGVLISGVLFVSLLVANFELMVGRGMWLELMLPATMLLAGFLVLDAKRFLVAERGKLKSDAESAESNRMLGLAFQGQGQLDMAFDKFRKVPLDDSLMEVMYNLGLDFERKRQFNKAESVFRYMAGYNPKFRDLEQRIAQSRAMSETVVLGGGATRSNASTLVLDKPGVAKPMLGRYEIDKELGKGAMGVVYQGKDPKIGRVVAIKTMALSQEFEPDELEDVKARFFREAETAGRLNHPNIVTMYDAGEEHDLAFIAMEFLKGRDLAVYAKQGSLLPVPKVLDIVARVADALSYAHTLNVVHRDIKPHNIMYDPDTDMVKVTDFGIARITDSSKTKTGMVLGTPSYMSPEQLAGKKIEGRSDLFSLGVSLYQLICGTLPFQGDSLAQLMFRIASEPHKDILKIRPDVPRCVVKIINKALDKDVDQRYQSGSEMADALRKCAASLQGGQ